MTEEPMLERWTTGQLARFVLSDEIVTLVGFDREAQEWLVNGAAGQGTVLPSELEVA